MLKKLILCVSLIFGIIACTDVQDKKEDIIRLGTSPDYPPFEYKKEGVIDGFDIALAKEIASRLGKKLEIQELDYSSLIPAIGAGKLDCAISGFTVTPERAENVDFSNIYYQASIVGIAKENVNISDFSNKKIGAQLGSVMEVFAKQKQEEFHNVEISSLANNLHLLQELKLGRIDILLLEEGQLNEILSANPGLISYVFPKTSDGYAIAFPKGSPLKDQFNQALQELNSEGVITKLIEEYLNPESNDVSNLIKALTYIPYGIFVTLKYALLSVFIGLIIGSFISLARLSSNKFLRSFAVIYLSIIRGTPLLLQLFIMYFAVPALLKIEISAFTAGIIAFAMNSGAYVSENIRAGIESVDKGQFEAAKSLGMPYKVMMQHIIMPQAIRNILPALVNEAINMVKESSIISVIGEADIMRRANIIAAEQYSYLEPLLVAALCYYILVAVLSIIGKKLEKRLKQL